jgi:hypothetical protein
LKIIKLQLEKKIVNCQVFTWKDCTMHTIRNCIHRHLKNNWDHKYYVKNTLLRNRSFGWKKLYTSQIGTKKP